MRFSKKIFFLLLLTLSFSCQTYAEEEEEDIAAFEEFSEPIEAQQNLSNSNIKNYNKSNGDGRPKIIVIDPESEFIESVPAPSTTIIRKEKIPEKKIIREEYVREDKNTHYVKKPQKVKEEYEEEIEESVAKPSKHIKKVINDEKAKANKQLALEKVTEQNDVSEEKDYNNNLSSFEELLNDSDDEEESDVKDNENITVNDDSSTEKEKVEIGKVQDCKGAEIIVLNKITAKTTILTLKQNESEYCGNIEIKLFKIIKNIDSYHPDNMVLLRVTENRLEDDPKIIFQGWLFSASNSLSTLEHPVYEIFVKKCL